MLTLYLRRGCHLCEDMQRDLQRLGADWGFTVHGIDIDADPVLQALYHEQVPVLMRDGQEICRHFLDADALKRAIDAAAKPL
jgi:glutaredoxin